MDMEYTEHEGLQNEHSLPYKSTYLQRRRRNDCRYRLQRCRNGCARQGLEVNVDKSPQNHWSRAGKERTNSAPSPGPCRNPTRPLWMPHSISISGQGLSMGLNLILLCACASQSQASDYPGPRGWLMQDSTVAPIKVPKPALTRVMWRNRQKP